MGEVMADWSDDEKRQKMKEEMREGYKDRKKKKRDEAKGKETAPEVDHEAVAKAQEERRASWDKLLQKTEQVKEQKQIIEQKVDEVKKVAIEKREEAQDLMRFSSEKAKRDSGYLNAFLVHPSTTRAGSFDIARVALLYVPDITRVALLFACT